MTVRPKRPNIARTPAPGPITRVNSDREVPIDAVGNAIDQPLTYDELVRRYGAAEARLSEHVELLCEIYAALDAAKGNHERVDVIKKVKETILATEEVVLDE